MVVKLETFAFEKAQWLASLGNSTEPLQIYSRALQRKSIGTEQAASGR